MTLLLNHLQFIKRKMKIQIASFSLSSDQTRKVVAEWGPSRIRINKHATYAKPIEGVKLMVSKKIERLHIRSFCLEWYSPTLILFFFWGGEGVGYVTSSVCCVHFSLAKSRGLGLLLLFVSTFGVTGCVILDGLGSENTPDGPVKPAGCKQPPDLCFSCSFKYFNI